jgi:cytochrome c-type biogenesis protein CcmE
VTRKQRRLTMIAVIGVVLASALTLVLIAFEESIVFFNSPTDIAEKGQAPGERFRLGGLVADGSVVRGEDTTVRFVVTDTVNEIAVTYTGLLPDLFREGQGVVAEGTLDANGLFVADTVLARHDEQYMPREVADALKAQGHWKGAGGDSAGGDSADGDGADGDGAGRARAGEAGY